MKAIATFALGLGLLTCLGAGTRAEGKKEEKKEEKKAEDPKLEGKYTLVSGKKNGSAVDEDAKKAEFTFAADKITIKGKDANFVMGYKIDPTKTPMQIDMAIAEGPEGTKGAKALGIIEVKGDTLKLAYYLDKDKRPKDFEGKDGFLFEFKKAK